MNDATYLLMQAHRETAAAKLELDALVQATKDTEVLTAHEVKPTIAKAEKHLRHAHAAMTALELVASGVKAPPRG